MKIIEIKAFENGGHRNQTGTLNTVPEGWAVVPDDMVTENFPFGDVEVEMIGGVMTVTKWTPGVVPKVEPTPYKPTAQDDIDALLVDHEYRLTLLELGVNE